MAKVNTYYCTCCSIEFDREELLKHFRCPECEKFVASGTQSDWVLKETIRLQLMRQLSAIKDPEILKSALMLFNLKDDSTLKLMLMQEILNKLKK